jgi:hypothetical protein
VTEAEWLACEDPRPMLRQFGAAASVRKQRLLGLACCYRFVGLLENHDLQQALHVAESWIEGQCAPTERKNARRAASAAAQLASGLGIEDGLTLSDSAAWAVQRLLQRGALDLDHLLYALAQARLKDAGARAYLNQTPREAADKARTEAHKAELSAQCGLIREIFGNPFLPVTFVPEWRTTDVLLLANGIYEDKAFDRMPILADALQDAGCDNPDILEHCRNPNQTHVRGCWVLDLVLGKE